MGKADKFPRIKLPGHPIRVELPVIHTPAQSRTSYYVVADSGSFGVILLFPSSLRYIASLSPTPKRLIGVAHSSA